MKSPFKHKKIILVCITAVLILNVLPIICGYFVSDIYYFSKFGIGVTNVNNGRVFQYGLSIKTNEGDSTCYVTRYYKIVSLVFSVDSESSADNC